MWGRKRKERQLSIDAAVVVVFRCLNCNSSFGSEILSHLIDESKGIIIASHAETKFTRAIYYLYHVSVLQWFCWTALTYMRQDNLWAVWSSANDLATQKLFAAIEQWQCNQIEKMQLYFSVPWIERVWWTPSLTNFTFDFSRIVNSNSMDLLYSCVSFAFNFRADISVCFSLSHSFRPFTNHNSFGNRILSIRIKYP